ncbi:hypothetical protein SAMN04488003_107160 [Loktanella fryxellensis]|uniref:Uncharacterized protein n=1 Tax=Loktanella fryxellensis TaxID=245187 RepID=A0A1H8CYE2_9RHOB|nr:hypothetical protein [Loktanella fryxellensis]SEM99990.1 hypothetical protein SAMN04488003_107160 [Loktanella fryxellensis]
MTLDIFLASMAAVGLAALLITVLTRKGLSGDRPHGQPVRYRTDGTGDTRRP